MAALVTKVVPGSVLLVGVVGSTAYGLATKESDVDHLGIYLTEIDDVLGLKGREAVDRTVTASNPDVALHELYKYCVLALKCNPTVLELLWCDRYEIDTPLGLDLVGLRSAFLSERCVRAAYGGYAMNQAAKLVRRQSEGKPGFSADVSRRTAKHGRHCVRLLLQGRSLLEKGSLILDVSEQRDHIFTSGLRAVDDPEGFFTQIAVEIGELDGMSSVLAAEPDIAAVQRFLVEARRSQLR